jgi:hypothetical protein
MRKSWALLLSIFKGIVSRDFQPLLFSSNNTPGPTDSWDKAVSNIDSYSRRYSTWKIANFQFYFTTWGRQDHLWYFFAKLMLQRLLQKQKQWFFDHALRKKPRAMMHSAEIFLKEFCLRLRAMQLSLKFLTNIFLSTPRYAS